MGPRQMSPDRQRPVRGLRQAPSCQHHGQVRRGLGGTLSRPLHLRELCDRIVVSDRTLRLCCAEFLGRQTGDQRLDQTLFHGPRDFGMRQSWTLSRRRDRFARVGVASAPQDAGKAAELAPLVAKRARSGENPAIPFGPMAITFQTERLGVNSFSRSPRLWNMRSPACISLPRHTGNGSEPAGNVTKASSGVSCT